MTLVIDMQLRYYRYVKGMTDRRLPYKSFKDLCNS